MNRRRFLLTSVAGAVVGPATGEAQRLTTPRIAFLLMGTSQAGLASAFDAFRDGLRELGWTEPQNIVIDLSMGGGQP